MGKVANTSGASQFEDEYKQTATDICFGILKKVISNPELRHNWLGTFARLKSLPAFKTKRFNKLEHVLKFSDNSMPLYMSGPIMLAAGANKYATHLPFYHALGLGGLTVGSATLEPWPGNPYRPRMALLPGDRAMVHSMGLNNPGIEKIAHRVDFHLGQCHKKKLALGISVAESQGLHSPEEGLKDILKSFRKAYRAADYVEINVSCPNTEEERIDWRKDFLAQLLNEIMKIRHSLAPRKAVFLKLSPDMDKRSLDSTLQMASDSHVTGLIIFNSFPLRRAKYLNLKTAPGAIPQVAKDHKHGGISGRVLYKNTLPAVRFIKKQLPRLHVIASGGIDTGSKVLDLLKAGADAVQCFTVLSYRWNAIQKMNRELSVAMEEKGIKSLDDI